jgi:hypothetical protein
MSPFPFRLIGSSVLGAALLALAIPAAGATTGPALRIAPSATGRSATATGVNDNFNANSCVGSNFCMALGNYTVSGHRIGLAEKLSGGTWVTETVPSPAHGWNVYANEVVCASSSSCLFVGQHWAGKNGPSGNLAEYWNGSSWRIVAAPAPTSSAASALGDVACPSTRFCLAVGEAGPRNRYQAAAYTLKNGTAWRRIALRTPRAARNSELGGLACFSPSNCMAVGNYHNKAGRYLPFAERWRSGRWQLLTTPALAGQYFTQFQGISCPTATLCVAVGNTEDNTSDGNYHAFAEVWSGGKWRVSTLRRQASAFLGVSCPTRNRCFAAGYTFPGDTAHSLIETWNGRSWTTQRTVQTAAPYPGGDFMHVSCAGRSTCEAVGFRFNPASNAERTLAEKWNGSRWALQTTVNP